MNHSYTIGEPITSVPPVEHNQKAERESWMPAYAAARAAQGQWVPITMASSLQARSLAAVARKRHQFDSEARKNVCYLRVHR